MELRYSFSGVDCPNCAAKIESRLNKLRLVQSARMDFTQATLRVEAVSSAFVEDLEKDINAVFQEIEKGSSIRLVDRKGDSEIAAEAESSRRLILPVGDFKAQCGVLQSLGGELVTSDENSRVVELAVNGSWYEVLKNCEREITGIIPFQEDLADAPEEDSKAANNVKLEKLTLLFGALSFGLAIAADRLFQAPFPVVLAVYALSYLLSAYPILLATLNSIRARDPFNENFLMSVATIGAFIIGENAEGVLVMLLYRLGELFQEKAVNQSRDSIKQLMSLKPDHANLLFGARAVSVDPKWVCIGDRIEVRPGERIPLDGFVVEGATSLDASEMTGESAPRDIGPGDEALSGAINGGGLIIVEVTKTAGDSSVSRVLKLVRESSANKASKERIFTRFARVYTPLVCLAAVFVMLIPPLIFSGDWYAWIYRGLSFLVVSCPCALVLSIPLSFFGGVGAASKRGILVKGGECLETLSRIEVAVFDKTGTLTEGIMEVVDIHPTSGVSAERLLSYAAAAESRLNHPIAEAIVRAAGQAELPAVSEYENIPGEGIRCLSGQTRVAVGNRRMMYREGAEFEPVDGTAAYVSLDGKFAGFLLLEDRIREDAPILLASMKKLGIIKTAMLTGDNAYTAKSVAKRLGVDEVRAELLPDQKVGALKEVAKGTRGGCLFVGDGVNDAPVLTTADVGIAMGGIGSDAAIEAADVVLLSDQIGRISEAVMISRRTQVNVYQNITLALGVKLIAMLLIVLGIGEMWMAVIADAGVALVCVLNALRLLSNKGR